MKMAYLLIAVGLVCLIAGIVLFTNAQKTEGVSFGKKITAIFARKRPERHKQNLFITLIL